MEVLLDSVCILCEEVTAVLTPQCVAPYMKYLHNTYFDKSKDALQEFQTNAAKGSMCALCSHQVVIAHKFKDSYEDTVKRSSPNKKNKTGCFICEQKGVDLIETVTNPNTFDDKISCFMDASVLPTLHAQCMVCFDCIFYLNVWYKIFTYIQKKCQTKLIDTVDSATPSTRTKAQKKVHFNEDDTIIEINGPTEHKEMRQSPSFRKGSPPPSAFKSSLKTKPATFSAKKRIGPLSSKRKVGPLSSKKRAGPLSTKKKGGPAIVKTTKLKRNKNQFKNALKKQLKHLKTIKQVKQKKKWSKDVLLNKKIYLDIPYVLLSRNRTKKSNLSNEDKEGSKSPELIEISDSDDDSSVPNKPMPAIKKKIGFKIKMSSKFMAASPKPKSKRSKKQLEDIIYTCDICDQTLSSLSEYKTHTLWHEKPERPVVNVVRSDFSEVTKLSISETDNLSDNEDANKKVIDDEVLSESLQRGDDDKSTDETSSKETEETPKENLEETNEPMNTSEEKKDNETDVSNAAETNNHQSDLREKDLEQEENQINEDKDNSNKDEDNLEGSEHKEEKQPSEDKQSEDNVEQTQRSDDLQHVEEQTKDSDDNQSEHENADKEEMRQSDEEQTKRSEHTNADEESQQNDDTDGNQGEHEIVNADDEEKQQSEDGKQQQHKINSTDEEQSEHVNNIDEEEQTQQSENESPPKKNQNTNSEAIAVTTDSKIDEFNSDSENNDEALKDSLTTLTKDNGEVESDLEQENVDAIKQNTDELQNCLIQGKKRNHDENGTILENGNDNNHSKRAKGIDNETEIQTQDFTNDIEI